MTRLIVEDGDKRRAFNVGDGRMSIGSSPDATLRLSSPGVADVHCDVEIREGRVVLRPRAGVVPPTLGGAALRGEAEFLPGLELRIGEATLRIETAAASARGPVRTGSTGRVPGRAPVRASARDAQNKAWMPAWTRGVLLFLGILVAGGIGYKLLTQGPTASAGASVHLNRVREQLGRGEVEAAQRQLDALADARLSGDEKAQFDALASDVAKARAEVEQDLANMVGTKYLQTFLQNFEENYLRGQVDRPHARVFLKRCDEFKKRWPTHPQMDWVDRMRDRFQPVAQPSEAPTFEDVEFEVKTLTWANPRDFAGAFALLDDFEARYASSGDTSRLAVLRASLKVARKDWFDDRMQQARFEFEREDLGKSVAWLVMLVVYTGDADMSEQAAKQLVKFDGIEAWLRGYAREEPEKYARLAAQPLIADYIREHGL